jgi:hypothetical protein
MSAIAQGTGEKYDVFQLNPRALAPSNPVWGDGSFYVGTDGVLYQKKSGVWVPAFAGSGHTIQDEGTPLTTRTNLNFVGGGITVTDDPGNDATVVTVAPGTAPVASVNGQTGTVVLNADNIDDAATTNKFTTAADISKLAGIEAAAKDDQNADQVPVVPTGNLASNNVQSALEELQTDIDTGTGDMIGANNLSEITNPATARNNIGALESGSGDYVKSVEAINIGTGVSSIRVTGGDDIISDIPYTGDQIQADPDATPYVNISPPTDRLSDVLRALDGVGNMGNHTATQDIDMAGNDIVDAEKVESKFFMMDPLTLAQLPGFTLPADKALIAYNTDFGVFATQRPGGSFTGQLVESPAVQDMVFGGFGISQVNAVAYEDRTNNGSIWNTFEWDGGGAYQGDWVISPDNGIAVIGAFPEDGVIDQPLHWITKAYADANYGGIQTASYTISNPDFTGGNVLVGTIAAPGAGKIIMVANIYTKVTGFSATTDVKINVEYDGNTDFAVNTNVGITTSATFYRNILTSDSSTETLENKALRIELENATAETTTGSYSIIVKYEIIEF